MRCEDDSHDSVGLAVIDPRLHVTFPIRLLSVQEMIRILQRGGRAGGELAKFHYTDPTGPARTQRSFAAKKYVRVRSGPCSGI